MSSVTLENYKKVRGDISQLKDKINDINDKKEEVGYFSLNIDIKFFVNNLNEVEVDRDGKKLKLDNCDIEIEFNSKLVRNDSGDWDENGLMFKIYERYIIKDKIEQFKIELYKDTTKLMDEV